MDKDSIRCTVHLGVGVSIVYTALYIAFLILVVFELPFKYGYLRFDLLPGPLTDDRYSWAWWFVFINIVFRMFTPLFYLYTLLGFRESFKRRWFSRYLGWMFVLNIVTIGFIVLVRCLACNNESIPDSPCNDPLQYCDAFGSLHQDRCSPPFLDPPIDPKTLNPHPSWWTWLYLTIGFVLGDLLLYGMTKDMGAYAYNYAVSATELTFD